MSNLFNKLELEAFRAGINPRTQESRDWFRRRVQQLRRIDRRALMQEEPISLNNRTLLGSMNMFFYDPKHKDTLPYYDRFPLAIIVKPAPGGFMGINLHYLPPVLRARFLDALLDITNNKKYDESTRFNLTLKTLEASSRLRFFKPCLKHYLYKHVRSRFARVSAPEWEIATFLPSHDFAKASTKEIYKQSRTMV